MNPQRTLFLHIGWHKTGTSAIQAMLRKNQEVLEQVHGIYYPETGRKRNAHYKLANSLFYSDPSNTEFWKKLNAELTEISGWKTAIISAESLDRATEKHIRLICDSLCGEWNTKIICYLRSPDEFLESSFLGKVKKGEYSGNWQEFRDNALKNGYPNYSEVIRRWQNIFGENAVMIRPYDKKAWINDNLFADFFASLGHEGVESTDGFFLPGRINASAGVAILSIIREVYRRLREKNIPFTSSYIKKHIHKRIRAYDDGKPIRFFTQQERIDIRNLYSSAFQELGIDFSTPIEHPEESIHSEIPEYNEIHTAGEDLIRNLMEPLEESLTANREEILRVLDKKNVRRTIDKELQGKIL